MTEQTMNEASQSGGAIQSDSTLVSGLIDQTLRAINDADAEAARRRVAQARDEQRHANDDALIEQLIKQKALQTGMVGAVTSGAAVIPGLGTLAAFTLGVATDVGVTMRLQSELVMEIAAARGHTLSEEERRNAIMLVTGVNLGAERVVNQASRKLAEKAVQRFGGRAFVKAIPLVGVAVSASANLITTYLIGRRADAYFSLGPDHVGDWSESARAISGMDERKLLEWLTAVLNALGAALATGSRNVGSAAGRMVRSAGDSVAARARARRTRRSAQNASPVDEEIEISVSREESDVIPVHAPDRGSDRECLSQEPTKAGSERSGAGSAPARPATRKADWTNRA